MKLLQSLIIIVLLILIGYTTKDHWFDDFIRLLSYKTNFVVVPEKEASKDYAVKRVQVLRGDQFDLLVDGEIRILGKLKVLATEDAKSKVVNLLSEAKNAKIRLISKLPDGQWLIVFTFEQNGSIINLDNWLIEKKLIYE